jgi:uncharacterized protein YbjT (DUF2867 family)
MKTVLILGASGLVGAQALGRALAHPDVGRVIAPTRRPLTVTRQQPQASKLENPLVDFEELPEQAPWWRADAAICALGTTIREAGSQAAFHRVDHDYVLAAAGLACAAGTPSFALVSALGADQASRNFYLRVKGETERDLMKLGFTSLVLARPSLLHGGPRRRPRPVESLALFFARPLAPILPRRLRPVAVSRVAQAMLDACLRAEPGVHIIESEGLHS